MGAGILFSNAVYQLSFNIFILGAIRKFKINNEACTSFKIEKRKLLLTMPQPRADLLPQMPHPGEDKVVKCPTNARGGCALLELTESLMGLSRFTEQVFMIYRRILPYWTLKANTLLLKKAGNHDKVKLNYSCRTVNFWGKFFTTDVYACSSHVGIFTAREKHSN